MRVVYDIDETINDLDHNVIEDRERLISLVYELIPELKKYSSGQEIPMSAIEQFFIDVQKKWEIQPRWMALSYDYALPNYSMAITNKVTDRHVAVVTDSTIAGMMLKSALKIQEAILNGTVTGI